MMTLKRQNLSDQVVGFIHNYIVENRLMPGSRLPTEAEFCQKLQVSRTTVREAMKQIQASGLIDMKPGVGVIVREFSPDALFNQFNLGFWVSTSDVVFRDLLEARAVLEEAILPLSLKNATDADLAQLRAWLERIKSADSLEQRRYADAMFHESLIEACHNPVLTRLGSIVLDFFRQSMQLFSFSTTQDPVQQHIDLVDAIEARDVTRAIELMQGHLDGYRGAMATLKSKKVDNSEVKYER